MASWHPQTENDVRDLERHRDDLLDASYGDETRDIPYPDEDGGDEE